MTGIRGEVSRKKEGDITSILVERGGFFFLYFSDEQEVCAYCGGTECGGCGEPERISPKEASAFLAQIEKEASMSKPVKRDYLVQVRKPLPLESTNGKVTAYKKDGKFYIPCELYGTFVSAKEADYSVLNMPAFKGRTTTRPPCLCMQCQEVYKKKQSLRQLNDGLGSKCLHCNKGITLGAALFSSFITDGKVLCLVHLKEEVNGLAKPKTESKKAAKPKTKVVH